MQIGIDETMAYIRENFNISGEAQRMTDALVLILDVLGGFGFEKHDIDTLIASRAIVEDA